MVSCFKINECFCTFVPNTKETRKERTPFDKFTAFQGENLTRNVVLLAEARRLLSGGGGGEADAVNCKQNQLITL